MAKPLDTLNEFQPGKPKLMRVGCEETLVILANLDDYTGEEVGLANFHLSQCSECAKEVSNWE